jgi:hypothetical protein
MLISTPDRDLARGATDLGPPGNPAHVREWDLGEFAAMLDSVGISPFQVGHTINTDLHRAKSTLLAVSGSHGAWRPSGQVSVLAVIHAYNEADVIGETVGRLVEQGVDVLIVDDWSTDATYGVAMSLAAGNRGRVRVVREPERRPAQDWFDQLSRTERIGREAADYDWVLHHDADEWRMSPWAGVGLRDAIAFVDALGYNALDHTVVDFRYLAGGQISASTGGMMDRLLHFEFGRRPGHFSQVKGWRRRDAEDLQLAASGGHDAAFSGRRIYPFKFLMRHYPLRGPDQARRKIFEDRLPRQQGERVERGWHVHYDQLASDPRVATGWEPHELLPWSEPMFHQEFLVERLSGIGITGD